MYPLLVFYVFRACAFIYKRIFVSERVCVCIYVLSSTCVYMCVPVFVNVTDLVYVCVCVCVCVASVNGLCAIPMLVCMYVCIYVYMYVCMHVYMHVCMYVELNTTYLRMVSNAKKYICIFAHALTQRRAHTRMHACTRHQHIHT